MAALYLVIGLIVLGSHYELPHHPDGRELDTEG
jgi:hypothetical protein